jgi:DNA-directed RNA polymerase III subunit RPC4
MDVDQPPPATEKKVTFAADVKPEASTSQASVVPEVTGPKVSERVSGAIGRLEVYRSGAVKMRLTNNILLDVLVPSASVTLQTLLTAIL